MVADWSFELGELGVDRDEVVAEFGRYLQLERDLSAHTVRAYVSDVNSLLDHLGGRLEGLDVGVLRSGWPGSMPRGRRGPRWRVGPPALVRSPPTAVAEGGWRQIRGCCWGVQRRAGNCPQCSISGRPRRSWTRPRPGSRRNCGIRRFWSCCTPLACG
ncbi:site-specific integrase [Nonomuraea antimicrobica]